MTDLLLNIVRLSARSSSALACLTGAASLAGCAATPARPLATPVVLVPSNQMSIGSVKVEERDTSVLVRGQFARRPFPPRGDLHVEAWRDQRLVTWRHASWRRYRGVFRSYFSAKLPLSPPQIDEIRISYHRSGEQEPVND